MQTPTESAKELFLDTMLDNYFIDENHLTPNLEGIIYGVGEPRQYVQGNIYLNNYYISAEGFKNLSTYNDGFYLGKLRNSSSCENINNIDDVQLGACTRVEQRVLSETSYQTPIKYDPNNVFYMNTAKYSEHVTLGGSYFYVLSKPMSYTGRIKDLFTKYTKEEFLNKFGDFLFNYQNKVNNINDTYKTRYYINNQNNIRTPAPWDSNVMSRLSFNYYNQLFHTPFLVYSYDPNTFIPTRYYSMISLLKLYFPCYAGHFNSSPTGLVNMEYTNRYLHDTDISVNRWMYHHLLEYYNVSNPENSKAILFMASNNDLDDTNLIVNNLNTLTCLFTKDYVKEIFSKYKIPVALDISDINLPIDELPDYDSNYIPYPVGDEQGPPSHPQGGTGNFDNSTVDVPIPVLPTYSTVSTGMISGYVIDDTKLTSLGTWLWSDNIISQILQRFTNVADGIVALYACQVPHSNIPFDRDNFYEMKIGGIETGISSRILTSDYGNMDMGTLELPLYFGNFLDFDPYTKIQLYLPYIGYVPLKADDVMGRSINVIYHFNFISGSCLAFVRIVGGGLTDTDNNTVLYTYEGNFLTQIQLTTGLKVTSPAIVGATLGLGLATGNIVGVGAALGATNKSISKQGVTRNGQFSNTTAMMNIRQPFVVIERPIQSLALDSTTNEGYSELVGYPSNIYTSLSAMNGFTEVESIHIEGISCTDREKDMIENLLKEGVIL